MIEELRPTGHCDMTVDFAMMYATEMFLAILGLPVTDGEFMLPRVETIFGGFFGGDPAEQAQAADEIKDYFEAIIADRVERPGDLKSDFDQSQLYCFFLIIPLFESTPISLLASPFSFNCKASEPPMRPIPTIAILFLSMTSIFKGLKPFCLFYFLCSPA